MKRNMLASLVFATVLFAIPVLSNAQVTINLRTGAVTGTDPGGGVVPGSAIANNPMTNPPGCTGTWYQGHVTVNLQNVSTAFFTVEYEGKPSGWTVDIGDSPSDDGYGGGIRATITPPPRKSK